MKIKMQISVTLFCMLVYALAFSSDQNESVSPDVMTIEKLQSAFDGSELRNSGTEKALVLRDGPRTILVQINSKHRYISFTSVFNFPFKASNELVLRTINQVNGFQMPIKLSIPRASELVCSQTFSYDGGVSLKYIKMNYEQYLENMRTVMTSNSIQGLL